MSQYIDWEIKGAHKGGACLTGEEVRELVSLDEYDFGEVHFEADNPYIAEFSTTNMGAYGAIHRAVEEFAKLHPDICLIVYCKFENAWNADAFVADGGKVREATGHVRYTFDDTGEEMTFRGLVG